MSLPASQQRVLDRIEEALKKHEPRLASMFAMFGRLTFHEGLPRTETLQVLPWWSPKRHQGPVRARTVVLLSLAVLLLLSVVFLATSQSPVPCKGPVVVRGPMTEHTHVRNCPTVPVAKGYGHGP
jgi:hypothetical protein